MIVAHANGTRNSDATEARALVRVFGKRDAAGDRLQVGVRPPARCIGHIETVLALEALRRGVVPGIASLATLDRACAGLGVARRGCAALDVALVLSAGSRHQHRAAGADVTAGRAAARCGIDSVELARIERLLRETPADDLRKLWSDRGACRRRRRRRPCSEPRRALCRQGSLPQALSARSGARQIDRRRFFGRARQLRRAQVVCAPAARSVLAALSDRAHRAVADARSRQRGGRGDRASPQPVTCRWSGKLLYHLLPMRRSVILDNLRRVFGETSPEADIVRLAQAHYAPSVAAVRRVPAFRWLSAERKRALVRVENIEALRRGAGTGQGRAHPHRPLRQLGGVDDRRHRQHFRRCAGDSISCAARSSRAGSTRSSPGVSTTRASACVGKRGSLDAIARPPRGTATSIVFPFDQHARPPDGIAVDFFGHPAWTFKSLAIIALATGAPGAAGDELARGGRPPRAALRGSDAAVEDANTNEAIRRNTRAYNAVLERLVLAVPSSGIGCTGGGRIPARIACRAPMPLESDRADALQCVAS